MCHSRMIVLPFLFAPCLELGHTTILSNSGSCKTTDKCKFLALGSTTNINASKIQSNLNGSNSFGTMEIRSRHG